MRKLVQSSASPATNRQYKQQLDTFIDFHKTIHETYKLPASPNTVSMFAAQLHERGLKCATIQTYMSAISNAHKLQNISDPTITYLVTKTLQGIKKNEPVITTNRLPITKTILHKIISNIPFCTSCTYTQIMLRALFLLTYHACLRAGEAVFSNEKAHTLTMAHLKECSTSYRINFTSYKHSGTMSPTLVLQQQTDEQHCPVLALRCYISKRGAQAGPIFVDNLGTPLTRDKFAYYLKTCLQLGGLPHDKYTTHSLRIGRATQLAMEGASESVIKSTGRWKSNAFQKYIRPSHFTLPL